MSDYDGEDRRQQPYSNTIDMKTLLTMLSMFLTVAGGLVASWISLNNQITKIQVTQDLKFEVIQQHIIADAQKEQHITSRLDELDRTTNEIYNRYQRGKTSAY